MRPIRRDARRLYRDLAWTWPIISPPEYYATEASSFARMIRRRSRSDLRTLLDLGCGGGHIDHTLRRWFRVTGVDTSRQMLALAGRLNPEVRYVRGDMRTIRLGRRFDAVVVADSINYMLTEDDLRQAFATAFVHLRPGGVFCTYAEVTKERFRQNSTSVLRGTRGDVDITFVETEFDPDPEDSQFEVSFAFFIRRHGRQSVELDRHLNGLFPLATWCRLLENAGFDVYPTTFGRSRIPSFTCVRPPPKREPVGAISTR